jgi:hypothetical protein
VSVAAAAKRSVSAHRRSLAKTRHQATDARKRASVKGAKRKKTVGKTESSRTVPRPTWRPWLALTRRRSPLMAARKPTADTIMPATG